MKTEYFVQLVFAKRNYFIERIKTKPSLITLHPIWHIRLKELNRITCSSEYQEHLYLFGCKLAFSQDVSETDSIIGFDLP